MAKRIPLKERFWAKVALPNEDGCMLWTAAVDRLGYARFQLDKRYGIAHRVAYELWVGPIPDGLEIDHLCRVRNCVALDHLEAVSRQENIRRSTIHESRVAYFRGLTHCKRGHEFTEENTLVYRGGRYCRECKRVRRRLKALEAANAPG